MNEKQTELTPTLSESEYKQIISVVHAKGSKWTKFDYAYAISAMQINGLTAGSLCDVNTKAELYERFLTLAVQKRYFKRINDFTCFKHIKINY